MTTKTNPAIESDRTQRIIAAKREFAVWRKWSKTREGVEPETPNLDAIRNQETIKEIKMSTTKTTVRFYRNGKPKADRYNTFGRLGRRDGYTAASMRETLAKEGITDPTGTTWVFTIPESGVVIGAVADGDDVPAELLVEKETTSKKDPAEKSTKKSKDSKSTKAKKSTRKPKAPKVEIVQHGKQSFAVVVDGEQHGKRLPSRNKAQALVDELTGKAA